MNRTILAALVFVATSALATQGNAPWCIAYSTGPLQCFFTNAALCQQIAAERGGMCVPNPHR